MSSAAAAAVRNFDPLTPGAGSLTNQPPLPCGRPYARRRGRSRIPIERHRGAPRLPWRERAERAGFEPATHLSARTRFPVALLRPLGHLSERAQGIAYETLTLRSMPSCLCPGTEQ